MISLFNVMLRKIFELPDLCLYIYIYIFFFFPSAFIVVVHFIILRIFHFLLTLIIVEKSAINLIRVFFLKVIYITVSGFSEDFLLVFRF